MFYLKHRGALIYSVTDATRFPHGFSTRSGGVSTLEHLATMNFTTSTGDSEENVSENYRIFLSALGLDPASRISSHQIHSAKVRYVTEADRGRVFDDCDGFVTDRPGVALIVKTADCVPILLADNEAGVIAAVHAGWRGTVGAIAPIAANEMVKLGASLENIRIAIGPCIHDCCFEVQQDFVDAVSDIRGKAFANAHIHRRGASRYADLVGMNVDLLEAAGIQRGQIDVAADCTCCAPFLYHSHRATHGKRGVMAAGIGLPGQKD
jgi:YfiH family protein